MKKIFILYLFTFPVAARSQKADETIKKGNDFYKQKQFANAAEEYKRAVEMEPGNQNAKFNLANTFYKQDNKVEAAQLFNGITTSTKETGLLSKAFYNKGVILSQQKNLEASIEAYKSALRNNADDKDARENLQKALLELKRKTPPPPKKKEQDKKKQQQQQNQQQKQQQSKLNQKEADQRLKLLEQKEKEVQQRVQNQKSRTGASSTKDW